MARLGHDMGEVAEDEKVELMEELDHLQMDEFNEFCDGLGPSNGSASA